MTAVLGISAGFHDAAAAIVVDGEIVAAAQQERFSRTKNDPRFPTDAIDYCLQTAGIKGDDLDLVVFYEKPLLKFDRVLETHLAYAPWGLSNFMTTIPAWLRKKLFVRDEIKQAIPDYQKRCAFAKHHVAHAASAFYPSPFEQAAILTIDGVGEWATTAWGVGQGEQIALTHELRFPHSLGLFYSAFTSYCGFRVDSGEYKLMGLAPYGEPKFVDRILNQVVTLNEDGSFQLNMQYFDFAFARRMTSKKFHDLLGGPPRQPGEPIEELHRNAAASIQKVLEEILLKMVRHIHVKTGMENLCLAGGVALNGVANGRIRREGPFENIWVQPAAGDAGGALGAALLAYHSMLQEPRNSNPNDMQRGSLLGPNFTESEIRKQLTAANANFEELSDDAEMNNRVAQLLGDQKVVGWFQGRMEFGPRALGNRSILADPRSETMRDYLNEKIKDRESFRPFAPAVLFRKASEHFEISGECPYMLFTADVAASETPLPAVTHVDQSARVQTVDENRFPRFASLLEAFRQQTGCPLLLNTSFNGKDEPIVCTPADAYICFRNNKLDALAIGRFLLLQKNQPPFRDVEPTPSAAQHVSLLELEDDPSPTKLRLFGVGLAILAISLAIIGLVSPIGIVWWSLAIAVAILLLLYAVAEPIRRPVFAAAMFVNYPFRWLISHVLLAMIYYFVLTPIGMTLRLTGRDWLGLSQIDVSSYWKHRDNRREGDQRNFQQF